MSSGLKSKTIHGLFWSLFERIGQQGMQFVISVILARILSPKEFGLIAMLAIFMAVAQSFIDSGFGRALIQRKNVTHLDESSIFYFNIIVGLFLTALLSLSAPWIAAFYNQPILTNLARAMSLNLLINSFGLVQIAILTKNIDFKTISKVSILATVLSGAVGIYMALHGYGVWSLVVQTLCLNGIKTILLWVFNNWRPAFEFSTKSVKEMFGYGSRLLMSGLLDTIFKNIYLLVIGKLFSPTTLGFYSRAKTIQLLSTQEFSMVISRVAFPVFSSIQDDPARIKSGMKKALSMMVFVNFPLMIGLAIVSKPFILVLLTEKWLPAYPYLQLLCVVGLFYPLHVINLQVILAKGYSDIFFRLEIIKKSMTVVSILITYRWGISAMIVGEIITSIIGYFINSYYTGKFVKYTVKDQAMDALPYLLLSLVMGAGVYSVLFLNLESQLIQLILQVGVGIVIYVLLNYFFKTFAFVYGLKTIKEKMASRKK